MSRAQDNAGTEPPDEPHDPRARSFAVRLTTAEMETVIAALATSGASGATELATRLRSLYDAWLPEQETAAWCSEPS